jgi:hypothetical protein
LASENKILLTEDTEIVFVFAYHLQTEIGVGWAHSFHTGQTYFVQVVNTSGFAINTIDIFPFIK